MIRRLALLGAFAFLAAGPAVAQDTPVTSALDGFVRPAYAAFAATSQALETDMQALCATPSSAALETVRGGFRDSVAAWSRIEIVRFGPVTEENRLERILFWPDRKSIGLKQVQRALAEQDASASDATSLAGKSVAMQGLGALEFILYGTDAGSLSGAGATYRCAYGRAVAANLAGIADAIAAEWARPDGFAAIWSRPGADNALYRTEAEALTELVDVFIHGLELTRDVRVKGFLGATTKDDKPKQAIFWRSGATVASLAGNMAGMHALFVASDLRGAMSEENRWIGDSILAQFANAEAVLAGIDRPVEDSLTDAGLRGKLAYVETITSSLSSAFGMRVAPDLGLSAGFSSLDGD